MRKTKKQKPQDSGTLAVIRAVRREREACAAQLEVDNVRELPHWPATAEEMTFAWAVRRAAARALRAQE